MSSAQDFVGGFDSQMTKLTELTRTRAGKKPDPYNPDRFIPDWENPSVLDFVAYVASQTSTESVDTTHAQLITTVQLVVPDAACDIRVGDRITDGTHHWQVKALPTADTNPFTGWRPTLVVDVEEVNG